MFGDTMDKMLILKIYEANKVCQDEGKTTFNGLVDSFCKTTEFKYADKGEVASKIKYNLLRLLDLGIINGSINPEPQATYYYDISCEFEPIAEVLYRGNINLIKENLHQKHFDLLDEIINKDDFSINGHNIGGTLARTSMAIDLAKYDLVRFNIDDNCFSRPMATVLGGVVNNDYLCGYIPEAKLEYNVEMEKA